MVAGFRSAWMGQLHEVLGFRGVVVARFYGLG